MKDKRQITTNVKLNEYELNIIRCSMNLYIQDMNDADIELLNKIEGSLDALACQEV